jgi:hypothetical protein
MDADFGNAPNPKELNPGSSSAENTANFEKKKDAWGGGTHGQQPDTNLASAGRPRNTDKHNLEPFNTVQTNDKMFRPSSSNF